MKWLDQRIKLRVSQIEKSFPGVKALDKIDFSVQEDDIKEAFRVNIKEKENVVKIVIRMD